MFASATASLLKEHLPHYPTLVMERELSLDIDALVAQQLAPMKLAVVDDRYTAEAYGERVFRALKGRFPSTHITLPSPLAADDISVQHLRAQTLSADALVAVGSGTINDLCKYVSHLDRKPYVVFPTAASMNGYVSANASISQRGHKKTLPAHMPQAVFCDLSVIAAAPQRLTASGLGDSLARATAQADWLLSHLLLSTPYSDVPFALLAPYEPQLMEDARALALGDAQAIGQLMRVLLLSGFGMTIAGGSYPASQGEHMIAHSYEMLEQHAGRNSAKTLLHGEVIGITTQHMAARQQQLQRASPRLCAADFDGEVMIRSFGSETASSARKAFEGKMALCDISLPGGISQWEAIAEKILPVTLSPEVILATLEKAGAPTHAGALKMNKASLAAATALARYTRERFTFLDVE